MNLKNHYRILASEIGNSGLRFIASCLSDHIGRENATSREKLESRTGFSNKYVYECLRKLVEEHKFPICSFSRPYLLSGEQARWKTSNALKNKEDELRLIRRNLEQFPFPDDLEPERQENQEVLF